jgi:major membrane immunogen (membrane-anchored lipoprotein)
MKRIVVVLALVFLVLTACGESGPGKRAVEAINLIQKQRPDKLDDYILKEDLPNKDSIYAIISEAMKQDGGTTKVTIESESVNGDRAKARITFQSASGKIGTEEFPMVREDGKWKMDL